MGCIPSRQITDGAVIVDSVVISNSRVRVCGDIIAIPIKDLRTDESAVISIDRKAGNIRILRGNIHARLNHDAIINDAEFDDEKKNGFKSLDRESYSM